LPEQYQPISAREVAFFGLQGIIPAVFAIVPAALFIIGFGSAAGAVRKFADGTLVLISFTMLISLSQDLRPAVKPYHRDFVGRLELLLRIAAIVILGVYTLFQSTSMLVLAKESSCAVPYLSAGSTAGKQEPPEASETLIEKCKERVLDLLSPTRPVPLLDIALSIFSGLCFIFASILSLRILSMLRPHFTDRS
jgi:hypothetical protein